ncbi:hypothetical protein [Dyadobacter alkalitolerans]|uniref:hypothetical protein n=1 Tax=Dyadobacter alkalitolerans TaxID=492736 RepID=UPI0006869950|nr:hypothetical protein [Dyadobacter alkalitolerans]
MTKFETFIASMQKNYPSAKKIVNYGYTFLIDETALIFIAYQGRSTKAVIRRHFKSLDELNKCYHSLVNKAMETNKINSDRDKRQQEKNAREIQPGAIFYTSWGYDQTNIEFFQIIDVKGAKVLVREINQDKQYDDSDRGKTSGIKDDFKGETFSLRIGKYGMKLNQRRHLSKWDGKPLYWSSYA